MKYFAYGSNCNPSIMKRKGVTSRSRRRAVLHGYRLRFNKRALRETLPETIGFASIEEEEHGRVEGVLYDIEDDHLDRLDRSERHPDHYARIEVQVDVDGELHDCWTYQAQPDKVAEGLVPSRNDLNHILAARDFLSEQYYQALDCSLAYSGECACCHRTGEVLFLKEHERMYTLCQPCREARVAWGDARGRQLSVVETEAVVMGLVRGGTGFASVRALVEEAIALRLIDP